MVRSLLNLMIAAVCLNAVTSYAEDFKPEEVPPQRAKALYKATNASGTYYLLTKDEDKADYQDSGNHYLLVNEGGKLRLPRQTRGMVYYDGGSADIEFENGQRIILPTDRVAVGYLGVNTIPMMISSDRAPINLKKIEITDSLLKRLGFARFIAPKKAKEASQPFDRSPYVSFVSPETVQIIEFIPNAKLEYQEKTALNKLINELDPSRIKLSENNNQGAFNGYGDSVIITVTEPKKSLTLLKEKLSAQGKFRIISDDYLESIEIIFSHLKADAAGASDDLKNTIVEDIYRQMGQLERYFLAVDLLTQYETAAMAKETKRPNYVGTAPNTIARRKHPFYKIALEKIRRVARAGYEALDQIGNPAAQEILTHTANEFDFDALDIVRRKATVGGQYYFDLWLKFMLSDLDFVDTLSETDEIPSDMLLGRSSGGVYQDFHISGDLTGVGSHGGIVTHFYDKRPKFMITLLGLPGSKEHLKTSLIQYVISADKKAAKLVSISERQEAERGSSSFQDSFKAKGITNINQLLSYMAWTPYYYSGIPGFSVTEYQVTVMELYATLFAIAPTSLTTTGTMAALIDASIHILNDVQNKQSVIGLKPNARTLNAARVLENRMRVHLQKSVEALGFGRKSEFVAGCEILLAPNAFDKMRKAGGF